MAERKFEMTKDKKELFKEAAAIAAELPESMHDAAFNRALDMLIEEQGLAPPADKKRSSGAKPKAAAGAPALNDMDMADRLMQKLDRTAHPEIVGANKVLDRSLFLLRVCRDEEAVDGLTTGQIARILTEKFRVKTAQNTVSMALGSAGSFVDRTKRGSGFIYRLMSPGETYAVRLLADAASGSDATKTAAQQPRKRPKARETKAKPPAKMSVRKQTGRPGPKKMLSTLIDIGYFSTPRTISQILDHLLELYGRRYKATDLSPALLRLLRDRQLGRIRNADSQYEYKAS